MNHTEEDISQQSGIVTGISTSKGRSHNATCVITGTIASTIIITRKHNQKDMNRTENDISQQSGIITGIYTSKMGSQYNMSQGGNYSKKQ